VNEDEHERYHAAVQGHSERGVEPQDWEDRGCSAEIGNVQRTVLRSLRISTEKPLYEHFNCWLWCWVRLERCLLGSGSSASLVNTVLAHHNIIFTNKAITFILLWFSERERGLQRASEAGCWCTAIGCPGMESMSLPAVWQESQTQVSQCVALIF
jgi:hypothetical protein